MPADDSRKRRISLYRTFALAMELPLIIVLAPLIGFLIGQWLDEKLGTSFLSLLLGVLGFVAGLREVLRRIPKDDDGAAGKGDDGGNGKTGGANADG